MPLYIAQSGDIEGVTNAQYTTLEDRATQPMNHGRLG